MRVTYALFCLLASVTQLTINRSVPNEHGPATGFLPVMKREALLTSVLLKGQGLGVSARDAGCKRHDIKNKKLNWIEYNWGPWSVDAHCS